MHKGGAHKRRRRIPHPPVDGPSSLLAIRPIENLHHFPEPTYRGTGRKASLPTLRAIIFSLFLRQGKAFSFLQKTRKLIAHGGTSSCYSKRSWSLDSKGLLAQSGPYIADEYSGAELDGDASGIIA